MNTGTCIAVFLVIFVFLQFSLWARYGNLWTLGDRPARRGYTTRLQKKINTHTTDHVSDLVKIHGNEWALGDRPEIKGHAKFLQKKINTTDHASILVQIRPESSFMSSRIFCTLVNSAGLSSPSGRV